MSGYRQEAVAAIVGTYFERLYGLDENINPLATLLDLANGWKRVPRVVRRGLTSYLETGERPPVGDPDELRAEVQERKLSGQPHEAVSAMIRHVLMVRTLGREMSSPKASQRLAGRPQRGERCLACGGLLNFGDAIRWEERDHKGWHIRCFDAQ